MILLFCFEGDFLKGRHASSQLTSVGLNRKKNNVWVRVLHFFNFYVVLDKELTIVLKTCIPTLSLKNFS